MSVPDKLSIRIAPYESVGLIVTFSGHPKMVQFMQFDAKKIVNLGDQAMLYASDNTSCSYMIYTAGTLNKLLRGVEGQNLSDRLTPEGEPELPLKFEKPITAYLDHARNILTQRGI